MARLIMRELLPGLNLPDSGSGKLKPRVSFYSMSVWRHNYARSHQVAWNFGFTAKSARPISAARWAKLQYADMHWSFHHQSPRGSKYLKNEYLAQANIYNELYIEAQRHYYIRTWTLRVKSCRCTYTFCMYTYIIRTEYGGHS